MDYRSNRVRTLTIALLSVLAFSVVVSAQGVVEEPQKEDPPLVLFVVGCCVLPWILFALAWVVFGAAYPFMFLFGALFSGRNLERRVNAVVLREQASIEHFGKDPLSTLKGSHIVGGVNNSGLVYSSIVYAPSRPHRSEPTSHSRFASRVARTMALRQLFSQTLRWVLRLNQ